MAFSVFRGSDLVSAENMTRLLQVPDMVASSRLHAIACLSAEQRRSSFRGAPTADEWQGWWGGSLYRDPLLSPQSRDNNENAHGYHGYHRIEGQGDIATTMVPTMATMVT